MDNMVLSFFLTLLILVVSHAVISRRKINTAKVSWPYIVSLIISLLLLLLYIATLTFLFIEDTVWPHSGSLSIVFFMLMCPGILFHLFFLSSSLIKRKLPKKRILARIVTILLGFILGSQVHFYAQSIAMSRFEKNYQPLVESIQKNFSSLCNPQIPYKDQENLNAINHTGKLWFDKEYFLLSYRGGSADIDGSTIYYYSKEGEFKIFHNDNINKSNTFNALLIDMTACHEK